MRTIISLLLLLPALGYAQEAQQSQQASSDAGKFQLGIRSTVSAFSNDQGSAGTGVGGQFRVRLGNRMNTEWFADYITTDIRGKARRYDAHIGWSVMFYPFHGNTTRGQLTPYALAGHCFDYTQLSVNSPFGLTKTRWSSAVQAGLGTHYNITDRFDVSLSSQYMMHLGKDLHADIVTTAQGTEDVVISEENVSLEGHVLFTLSLNFYIADLWSRQSKN